MITSTKKVLHIVNEALHNFWVLGVEKKVFRLRGQKSYDEGILV